MTKPDNVVIVDGKRLTETLVTALNPYRDFLSALEQDGRISPEEHRTVQDAVATRMRAIGTFLIEAGRTPPQSGPRQDPLH